MEPGRFDSLTRSLSTRLSRRSALQAGGLGLAISQTEASTLGATAQDAPATPVATPGTEEILVDDTFLFVQTATSGSFTANPGAGTPAAADGTPAVGGGADYLLTLEGHSGNTIYFSDRPARIFGSAPTDQFLAGLGFAADNPPNAALVTNDEQGNEDVLVIELVDPDYDDAAGSVMYGVNVLSEYEGEGLTHVAERQQDAMLPRTFGNASLFIDDCPDIATCYGGLYKRPVGALPGGPAAACFSWQSSVCVPCSGQSGDYYSGLCNGAYPNFCRSGCVAR